MILLFYPVVKAPGLTLLHYKSIIEDDGNVKDLRSGKSNRYFYNQISDIILSQSQKKIEEPSLCILNQI
jgi:hypothetical protein